MSVAIPAPHDPGLMPPRPAVLVADSPATTRIGHLLAQTASHELRPVVGS
jgi:hypothetical protein